MRKLALLLAAALFVSAPLIAATPTMTYAAAKKKAPAKAPKAAPRRGGGGEAVQGGEDLNEVNSRFWRALNDLAISLSKPWPVAGQEGAGAPEGGRAPKAKNSKKSRS